MNETHHIFLTDGVKMMSGSTMPYMVCKAGASQLHFLIPETPFKDITNYRFHDYPTSTITRLPVYPTFTITRFPVSPTTPRRPAGGPNFGGIS